MARRILALDIGSHSLKAALIESTLRRCQVVGLFQRRRDTARPLAEQLAEFRLEHALRADTVVSSLPGDAVSVRFLTLPFTRPRQLEQTVPLELNNHIPFDLDAVLVDFHAVRRVAEGTIVAAVATPKTILTEHVDSLTAAGFDPARIDVTPLAPLALLLLANTELSGVTVVLDIGAHHTDIVRLDDGMLQDFRTLSIGLNHAGGFPALLQALRWTLLAQGGETPVLPQRFFLCGGGSRVTRLREELAQAFTGDIVPLHELVIPSVPEPLRQEQGVYATCLGLGLREALGLTSPAVNLRQGAFLSQGRREAARKELSRLRWIAAGVAAAAAVAFALEMHGLNTRYDQSRQEIRRVFTTTLPEVHTIVSEKAQLREAVETLQSRQRLFQGPATISPLELLRQLSAALPEQTSLDLDEWIFDDGSIRVRGSTSSFDAAETIKTTASGLGIFRDVQLKDVKAAAGGKKVSFGLQLAFGKQEQESESSREEVVQ
jgi:type II secretion system protein L